MANLDKFADVFEDELADLGDIKERTNACIGIFDVLSKPNSAPDDVLAARETCERFGMKCSTGFYRYEFWNKGQHYMVFNDVTSLCKMCFPDSPEVVKLMQHGSNMEDCIQLACDLLMDSVLVLMQTAFPSEKEARIPAHTSNIKKTIADNIKTLNTFSNARNSCASPLVASSTQGNSFSIPRFRYRTCRGSLSDSMRTGLGSATRGRKEHLKSLCLTARLVTRW